MQKICLYSLQFPITTTRCYSSTIGSCYCQSGFHPGRTFHHTQGKFINYKRTGMRHDTEKETGRNRGRDFLTWERKCSCFSCSSTCFSCSSSCNKHKYRLHSRNMNLDLHRRPQSYFISLFSSFSLLYYIEQASFLHD